MWREPATTLGGLCRPFTPLPTDPGPGAAGGQHPSCATLPTSPGPTCHLPIQDCILLRSENDKRALCPSLQCLLATRIKNIQPRVQTKKGIRHMAGLPHQPVARRSSCWLKKDPVQDTCPRSSRLHRMLLYTLPLLWGGCSITEGETVVQREPSSSPRVLEPAQGEFS